MYINCTPLLCTVNTCFIAVETPSCWFEPSKIYVKTNFTIVVVLLYVWVNTAGPKYTYNVFLICDIPLSKQVSGEVLYVWNLIFTIYFNMVLFKLCCCCWQIMPNTLQKSLSVHNFYISSYFFKLFNREKRVHGEHLEGETLQRVI